MNSQMDAFRHGEGDAWFARNRAGIEAWDPERDEPLQMLRRHGIEPKRAIEIGASNGYRMAALQQRHPCDAWAVDPSQAAIEDGRRRYPSVRFEYGEADEAPWQFAGVFDLVIVHFVLHWVERSLLMQSVAGIDRVLADGGHLVLGDFAPANRWRIPYRHRAGVWTYKQDYAALFLASGLYRAVAMQIGDHGGGPADSAPEGSRTAVWLLRKSLTDHYAEGDHG